MARGWESKDVESQQESLGDRRVNARSEMSEEQMKFRAQRETLMLDRTRVERDLAAARHPRHQEQLRQALAHLDRKLAEIPPDPVS